jgi:hypothetical protein
VFGTSDEEARAQARKVSGKGVGAERVARTELFLANMDTGVLESLSRLLSSQDPDWNGARVFSVRFSDPHARRERYVHGHMVVHHPGGDQTFLTYEFRWKPVGADADFEMVARFVRGTGKFKGISGSWRERGRSTVTEDTSEWEVEYELR